jgi:hypothetical protein
MEQSAGDSPRLARYQRFVESQRDALAPLWCYPHIRFGDCTGVAFVGATTPAVCHDLRIPQHRVFLDSARRGRGSTGWFYGFKLHLVINDRGELLSCYLTPGNADDRRPVPHLVKELWGRLFGDRGYIGRPLAALPAAQELRLITRLRKNMKNKFLALPDKLPLRKRALIETVNDQLKNISQI